MPNFPTGPALALVNRSTIVADAELPAVAAALQRQLEEHFAPQWGFTASTLAVPSTEEPPAWAWWIVLLDDADAANVLGYHDVTPTGRPLGKVFARTSQWYRVPWSVIASHELLEMLADPGVNLTAFNWAASQSGLLYAVEVADPVNGLSYDIDGVRVSDFVFPSWYRVFDPDNNGPYDFLTACREPFTLGLGGFQLLAQWGSTGWEFVTATGAIASAAAPPTGSRRERRIRGHKNWQRSTAQGGA